MKETETPRRPPRYWLILFVVAVFLSAFRQFLFGHISYVWEISIAGIVGGAVPALFLGAFVSGFFHGRRSLLVGLSVIIFVEASIMWTAYQDRKERGASSTQVRVPK